MSNGLAGIVSKAVNVQPNLSEIGLTGLKRDETGYVYEEFLPALQGTKALQVFKEMRDNDPVVGSTLHAIEMVVRQIPWYVEPAGNGNEDKRNAEFLEECRNDMSHTWDDFIVETMTMVPFGFAWFEIVYKKRNGAQDRPGDSSRFEDGRWGWRKFAIRSQDSLDRWDFDNRGGVSAMWQRPWPDFDERRIPIVRSLHFRPSSHKNNPEGRSSLRNAYRPWYFKRRIEELEGIGIERDLAGIPMAWVSPEILSPTATAEQKALLSSIKDMVKNIRLDQQVGVVLPAQYDERGNLLFKLELLGSPGSRQFNTDTVLQRLDQRIAMTLLADFILLGHQSVGSFALASSRTNLFAQATNAWVDAVEEVINRHAVPRLFRANGIRMDKLPEIRHGDISTPNLGEIAAFIAQTAGAGMPWFPDDRLEDWIRSMAKAPSAPPGGVPRQLIDPQGRPLLAQGRELAPGEKEEDRRRRPRTNEPQIPRGTPETDQTQRGL